MGILVELADFQQFGMVLRGIDSLGRSSTIFDKGDNFDFLNAFLHLQPPT